eukprot:TRINITY_DN1228_c0_g1_i4.p1 TRINITY_DN1228_c0_g1~~TRINITY_DN1228_c0_g1_i4.p1  ORF type:complete len:928 (+),score=257.64 TRINITY_DN1228_c0_g1_i4:1147-3930(+)
MIGWPLFLLPNSIASLSVCITSSRRLTEFFDSKEVAKTKKLPYDYREGALAEDAITITNGSFGWGPEKETLSGLNISIPQGKLCAVIGKVGAGKTSLLNGLLGEIGRLEGEVIVRGDRVAYVSQVAWIRNATIRDNILNGLPYNKKQYQEVVRVCCLQSDLEMMSSGDQTEIGERGINLSGGQKQRINLARACYSGSDVFLLDDPLSAVDVHVGKHIFEECILSHLIKTLGKTVVLVTHQLHFLPKMDYIIFLELGRVRQQGTYAELCEAEGDLFAVLEGEEAIEDTEPIEKVGPKEKQSSQEKDVGDDDEADQEGGSKITEAEERFVGGVGFAIYKDYLLSFGSIFFIGFVVFFKVLPQVLSNVVDLWLVYWSDQDGIEAQTRSQVWQMLAVFGLLNMIFCVSRLVELLTWFHGAWRASRNIHSKVLYSVLHSPMSFFHKTPTGRIINRFSKDQAAVDQDLPENLSSALICLVTCISTFVLMETSTSLIVIGLVPAAAVYYYVQKFYRKSSRELKRLNSISSSPIYSHFSEVIDGLPVIRAYDIEEQMERDNISHVECNSRVSLCDNIANRWLGVMNGMVGVAVMTMFTAFTIASAMMGYISPSFVSLVLVYALELNDSVNWGIRMFCETEAQMSRVERLFHYSNLQPEAALFCKDECSRVADWPSKGTIEFKHVSMRYRESLAYSLSDVSFKINHKEKIGVVGRTGAGKSSLMQCLFRIFEASEGSISIDDVDISKIGLHELRSKLSIIPQDPVLFSGTIRSNIDPKSEYEDEDVWDALSRAHLKDFVSGLAGKLDDEVEENGRNFSSGQKQLLCLARAILKNAKIIVMDEATASVDEHTDKQIQVVMREEFKDKTILTIAHRISTIIDFDRVIVMGEGKLIEFDSPYNLLFKSNKSVFAELVDGSPTGALLRRQVEQTNGGSWD